MINTDNDDCLEDGVCTWVNMDVSKLQSMKIKDMYDIKLKKQISNQLLYIIEEKNSR